MRGSGACDGASEIGLAGTLFGQGAGRRGGRCSGRVTKRVAQAKVETSHGTTWFDFQVLKKNKFNYCATHAHNNYFCV